MPQDQFVLSHLVRKNLLALGSAAVLTVYSAGYMRTRAAAERFDGEDAERRPAPPMASQPSTREALPPLTSASRPQEQPHRGGAVSAEVRGEKAVGTATASGLPPVVAVPGAAAPKSIDSLTAPASVAVTTPVDTVAQNAAQAAAQARADSIAQAQQEEKEKQRAYFKDGVYSGWGTSRHGDIQATVEINNGRITAAYVSQCLTRYSCSWIAALPPQVVARQSANVDYVSGATQSTNAFYYAVYQALTKAQ